MPTYVSVVGIGDPSIGERVKRLAIAKSRIITTWINTHWEDVVTVPGHGTDRLFAYNAAERRKIAVYYLERSQ